MDIQTEDPYDRLTERLNTSMRFRVWSKEEVRKQVATLKTEILSTNINFVGRFL